MPRITHFEIHAENPERAAEFYSQLLGWQFQRWDGPVEYWLITTGPDDQPGINGGMLRRRDEIDGSSVGAYVCTVYVDDVDAYERRGRELGATLAAPKVNIPGAGYLVYLKDTEGNRFGMMQPEEAPSELPH